MAPKLYMLPGFLFLSLSLVCLLTLCVFHLFPLCIYILFLPHPLDSYSLTLVTCLSLLPPGFISCFLDIFSLRFALSVSFLSLLSHPTVSYFPLFPLLFFLRLPNLLSFSLCLHSPSPTLFVSFLPCHSLPSLPKSLSSPLHLTLLPQPYL